MRIDVTQEDIDRGKRSRPCECPLAIAASRATGRPCSVGLDRIGFDDGLALEWPLPDIAFKFRWDFDNGQPVQPFGFDLPLEATR